MKYFIMRIFDIDAAYDYFLATLSNKTRLRILEELFKGPKNVSQLTQALPFDQSTISNNLQRLKKCGFVKQQAKGRERIYSLNKETIEPLIKLIHKHIKKYCVRCIQ
jgi:DNA-binding transcriptional ArsR family regulator